MVFRRRRDTDDIDDEGTPDVEETSAPEVSDAAPVTPPAQDEYAVSAPPRPQGPWDSHDAPKDDEVARVDLGGIHLPIPDGIEVRVEVQDDVPMAATLIDGDLALQVHAFAAPKSSGLWREVREEIAESLRGSGGSAEDASGPFGAELRAEIPVEEGGTQPARFIGVDGPRWFLRGLLTGPGPAHQLGSSKLEEAFRQIVVHRGNEAMAPRDMLPLNLPREALEAVAEAPEQEAPNLQLPERGPEITEIQ